jgi:hypothetical protein
MAKVKRWIITTGGDRPIREIARDLARAGLKGGKVLELVGSITGTANDTAIAKIRSVRGVVEVSPDIEIDIGPPDSKESW